MECGNVSDTFVYIESPENLILQFDSSLQIICIIIVPVVNQTTTK